MELNKQKNIKEQIKSLPISEHLQTRILELVIFANPYMNLQNNYTEFNLPQAFDWIGTREGGDYWLNVYKELEQYKFEIERR